MEQSKEKDRLFFNAPITSWAQHRCIFNYAYQGAYYDCNTSNFNNYLFMCEDDERNCIKDWISAVQKTEKTLLIKPFATWTIEDLKQISLWLTQSSCKNAGKIRTEDAHWPLRQLKHGEEEHLKKLSTKKFQHALNPSSTSPLTKDEDTYLSQTLYSFPSGEEVERELRNALTATQNKAAALSQLPFERSQQEAISLGCSFHIDIVRIHPFSEGAKRLGRLCMYIIHAQHGIKPYFARPDEYVISLVESLQKRSPKPFDDYFGSSLGEELPSSDVSSILKRALQLSQSTSNKPCTSSNTQSAEKSLSATCASCHKNIESPKCCGRCRNVHYCNRDCQLEHWKNGHKQECKSAAQ